MYVRSGTNTNTIICEVRTHQRCMLFATRLHYDDEEVETFSTDSLHSVHRLTSTFGKGIEFIHFDSYSIRKDDTRSIVHVYVVTYQNVTEISLLEYIFKITKTREDFHNDTTDKMKTKFTDIEESSCRI